MIETTSRGWDEFRRQMPITRQFAYFDHAAVAPLSGPAQAAMRTYADECAESGSAHWSKWVGRLERLRTATAQLIGATSEEIALVSNTSTGIGLVAEGLPWRTGDNVVVPASEFPSNLYPWLNLSDRGVETRRVAAVDERLDLAAVDAACDRHTRLIAVSWVGYQTGYRNDLDRLTEIAARHGALLLVDAIQGLGVLSLDVRQTPIDFLAADGHKWLLGPEGAGLLYVRRELLDSLHTIGVGWNSVPQTGEFSRNPFELKESAGRFEGGSQNMPGLLALSASLEFLGQFGAEQTEARLVEVTDQVAEALSRAGGRVVSDRSPGRKSGILACEFPGHDPKQLRRQCLEQGVIVNCRSGRLRISPHVYSNAEDLERLIAALPRVAS